MTDRVAFLRADPDPDPPGAWRGVPAGSIGVAFFFYTFVYRVAPSVIINEPKRDLTASGAVVGYLLVAWAAKEPSG